MTTTAAFFKQKMPLPLPQWAVRIKFKFFTKIYIKELKWK